MTEITLSAQQMDGVLAALKELDGYQRVIGAGSTEQVVRLPYRFDGRVRLKLARLAKAVQPHLEAFAEAREGARAEVGDPRALGEHAHAEQQAAFVRKVSEMFADKVAVTIDPLAESDLKLDENPIPPSVLYTLLPVMAEAVPT